MQGADAAAFLKKMGKYKKWCIPCACYIGTSLWNGTFYRFFNGKTVASCRCGAGDICDFLWRVCRCLCSANEKYLSDDSATYIDQYQWRIGNAC